MRKLLVVAVTYLLCIGAQAADVDDSKWARTLERITHSVVSIQIDQTRSFDTEANSSGQATGFVVDAKRGLILTNRHVVTPGPVTSQAIFQNREEVALYPVYRDPVHDFGIYRYDPGKLRFIQPAALPLYPQGATIGREIRVVGNDAGEQLSILSGTLARLDRQAPEYGSFKFNDFNTFYIQAASGTSGGSSGSPVLDIEGRVVALNAGGSNAAASSFYLPLNRVVRALKLIQEGKPVTRGTVQTVFTYTPYDELTRLGLDTNTEAEVRRIFPSQTGMLVVSEVQPGSAAAAVLEPGDILVRVNGELLTTFDPLERVLDDSVDQRISLEIRRGEQVRKAELKVQSLYEITPDRYLSFSDGVVHALSWQMARHYNKPVAGVFVASPGYALSVAGVPRGAVITEVNETNITTLDDFSKIIGALKDGERATLRYFAMDDPRASRIAVLRMDRRWYAATECSRDDVEGVWPCTTWPQDGVAAPPEPTTTQFAKSTDPLINRLSPSLVLVKFDMPYSVSGYTDRSYYGTGIVLDAAKGLVVVDRNTIPVPVGDVRLIFAGAIEVPGKVKYIHPLHNLAVVSYDPALLGDTPVRSAKLNTKSVRAGETVWAVGLDADAKVKSQSAIVAEIEPAEFPLSRSLRFREANLELINLVNGPNSFDGVLVNKKGEVVSSWSSYLLEQGRTPEQIMRGIPADILAETLQLASSGAMLQSLEAELSPISLADASRLGLPEQWSQGLVAHDSSHRQALVVVRLVAGSPAATVLRSGDLILAIDGKTVSRFREVELATQQPRVKLTVLRNGKEEQIEIDTAALSGRDIDRLVFWAGAVLQTPHRALAAQRNTPTDGVFVAYFAYGSPASRYQLWAGRRIVEVDGQLTPNLDAFTQAIANREDRSSVRLRTLTLNGASEVITLKLDNRYWPAYELKWTEQGWQRSALK
ncbi:MAG: trypsin-like peptidase domain-containing protein [Steroidobacteraceae bacterium]